MAHKFLDLAFTPQVLAAQQHYYGRSQALPPAPGDDPLGPEEKAFIETRDSFYLSSVSETGWPNMQHRGGPPGFCRVSGPGEPVALSLPLWNFSSLFGTLANASQHILCQGTILDHGKEPHCGFYVLTLEKFWKSVAARY